MFFEVRNFRSSSAMRVIFFRKCSKANIHLENAEKHWQNTFCFSENCMWIGCFKLSLFRREYLLSVVNLLTVITFSISLKENFSNSIAFRMISKYGNDAVVQIATVFGPVHNIACPRVRWNETFKHIPNQVFRSL